MKTYDNCPLCNARVSYRGLVLIECDGRGCPNYKAPPAKTLADWQLEFGDTLIDETWMIGLCSFLSAAIGYEVMLDSGEHPDFWYVRASLNAAYSFVVTHAESQRGVLRFLETDYFWGPVVSPRLESLGVKC